MTEAEENYQRMVERVFAYKHYQDDWDEALQYNALWTLISGFLSLSQSPEIDRAYIRECVDKAIRVLKK